jgi:hypothetical protein
MAHDDFRVMLPTLITLHRPINGSTEIGGAMMNRLPLASAAVIVFMSLAGRAAEPSVSLVGLWLGEERTEGGLGAWIEFRRDATVQFSFGALVDFTYRVDGTSLWFAEAGRPEVRRGDIRVNGNTAVLRQPPPADAPPTESLSAEDRAMRDRLSQPIRMTRMGSATPGAPPLVGTWTYTHYTGQTAYETFTADGKMFLRVPMQTVEGTYTATGEQIVVLLPTGNQRLSRNGDRLVLQSSDGKSSVLRRAPR